LVTEIKKKLKIDVVGEVHSVRGKHAGASFEEIEQMAAIVCVEIKKRKK
jgi:hypothetical protein